MRFIPQICRAAWHDAQLFLKHSRPYNFLVTAGKCHALISDKRTGFRQICRSRHFRWRFDVSSIENRGRKDRLAAALRENLYRRRTQARLRAQPSPEPIEPEDCRPSPENADTAGTPPQGPDKTRD
jgi:hypothetical protein